MIERCIVCHLKFVEQEEGGKISQFCGNCIQKPELEATKQGRRPSIASSENMLAVLEQTFRKSFGGAWANKKKPEIPADKVLERKRLWP